jgi:hypothetical protein
MDLAKFVWLLEHEALYFPRTDRLGDPHEGAIPEENIRKRAEEWGGRKIQWAPGLSGHEDIPRLTTRSTYVSCWNLSEHENASLWAIYGKSVAILSTFDALRESLLCEEPVHIGTVAYIDYGKDVIPTDGFSPLLHKRKYFENEQELRAVIGGKQIVEEENGAWHWATEDPRPGIEARVNLGRLVEQVRVAPGDPLLKEVVSALVKRYGLDADVGQSSLDKPPRF